MTEPSKPLKPESSLYDRIHTRFVRLGGIDLELPPREPCRERPRFASDQSDVAAARADKSRQGGTGA